MCEGTRHPKELVEDGAVKGLCEQLLRLYLFGYVEELDVVTFK